MPYAHDYYGPHHGPHDPNDIPHLHNRGEGRPYLEYDYHANDHGRQLPAISTIGRGPRGEGLTVGNVVNEDGTVSFALYSDLTGELLWQSPNLDPGTLDFYPTDFRDLVAGQPAPMDIVHTRGGVTKTTTAYLPCGERGSLVFLLGGRSVPRVPSDTYQTTAEELMIYGHRVWPNDNKPLPHVNDIVFFRYIDGHETGIAFGTIETVGTKNNENITLSTPVVFTARVFVPCNNSDKNHAGGSFILDMKDATFERDSSHWVFENIAVREVFEAVESGCNVILIARSRDEETLSNHVEYEVLQEATLTDTNSANGFSISFYHYYSSKTSMSMSLDELLEQPVVIEYGGSGGEGNPYEYLGIEFITIDIASHTLPDVSQEADGPIEIKTISDNTTVGEYPHPLLYVNASEEPSINQLIVPIASEKTTKIYLQAETNYGLLLPDTMVTTGGVSFDNMNTLYVTGPGSIENITWKFTA